MSDPRTFVIIALFRYIEHPENEGGPVVSLQTLRTSVDGHFALVSDGDVVRPTTAWYQTKEDADLINKV